MPLKSPRPEQIYHSRARRRRIVATADHRPERRDCARQRGTRSLQLQPGEEQLQSGPRQSKQASRPLAQEMAGYPLRFQGSPRELWQHAARDQFDTIRPACPAPTLYQQAIRDPCLPALKTPGRTTSYQTVITPLCRSPGPAGLRRVLSWPRLLGAHQVAGLRRDRDPELGARSPARVADGYA